MKFKVIETCEYEVEAKDIEQAKARFLEDGPEVSVQGPVSFAGAPERTIEVDGELEAEEF